jgi:hypothetical protein
LDLLTPPSTSDVGKEFFSSRFAASKTLMCMVSVLKRSSPSLLLECG